MRSLDPAKPVWDQARAYFDLQSGYDLKLFAGKVRTHVQLNVRNLLNAHDPVPVGALTTGAISRLATVDSRVTQLTFAVDF